MVQIWPLRTLLADVKLITYSVAPALVFAAIQAACSTRGLSRTMHHTPRAKEQSSCGNYHHMNSIALRYNTPLTLVMHVLHFGSSGSSAAVKFSFLNLFP